jgi:hypothetical protein
MPRGTTNRNVRGSSKDRAARKWYLLKAYASNVDFTRTTYTDLWGYRVEHLPTCRCYRCGELLTFDTVTVDRIIPGCKGGKYVRNNIRPACGDCNSITGGQLRGPQ